MTLSPATKISAAIVLVLMLAGVVMAAIATDRLGDFVLGLAVVGLVLIVLAAIGVWLFGMWGRVKVTIDTETHRHIEKMLDKGALPNNNRYRMLPPAPEPEYDLPISTSGETATTIATHRQEAIELLALTKQWHGENRPSDPTQIIPHRFAKKMHPYFAGDEGFQHWHNGMKFLVVSRLAKEKKEGGRSRGTYADGCTAIQLYERLRAG